MAFKLQDLLPIAIILTVGVIAITIGADIVQSINDGQTTGSVAENVSWQGLEAFQELGSWLPTIALIVAAALVIGILVSSFAFGGRN